MTDASPVVPSNGDPRPPGLPDIVVVGAMKCGTTALHAHLDRHPEIGMAPGKELNFFLGPATSPGADPADWWRTGQWHRGPRWYARQFPAAARLRGETSPGYTAPGHDPVAARMHALVPDVRLLYLVRDPVDRAVSQWLHHRRDGTEPRALEDALLDRGSQYLARSRYLERLGPFLTEFAAEQLLVVVQERLVASPRTVLRDVFAHVGADENYWHPDLTARVHVGDAQPVVPDRVRVAFWEEVGDDVTALRTHLDDGLTEWVDPTGPP